MKLFLMFLCFAISFLCFHHIKLINEIDDLKEWKSRFIDACKQFSENEQSIANHIRAIEDLLSSAVRKVKEVKETANIQKDEGTE